MLVSMASYSSDSEGPDDCPHRIDSGSALGVNFALFRGAFKTRKGPGSAGAEDET